MPIRYQGGKQRFAKAIYETITEYEYMNTGKNKLNLYSPFFGMGSVELEFSRRDNDERCVRKIFANDINEDVILMWEALQDGWLPKKTCSATFYNNLKEEEPSAERVFYLSAYAFGGVFGSSFRGKYQSPEQNKREGLSAYNNVKEVVPYLDCFKFRNGSYVKRKPKKGEMVYADPPYYSSLNYGVNKYLTDFDYDEFWETMREWSKTNLVFVSEEMGKHIPKDFVSIWSLKTTRTVGSLKGGKGKKKESLFIHKRYVSEKKKGKGSKSRGRNSRGSRSRTRKSTKKEIECIEYLESSGYRIKS